MNAPLPSIPAKRYFTIGEVAELCDVKPHVLRYWEQEFTQLRPMKRRGNRRYYQHHEVLMIRRIRELLYGQGFTISGARSRLQNWSADESSHGEAAPTVNGYHAAAHSAHPDHSLKAGENGQQGLDFDATSDPQHQASWGVSRLRAELLEIRSILSEEGN
ncbi:MerR family transcriptional regulator [Corticibacter populi]|uniref:MerR family transcriptional regulator n=1 Tax=Corticibacter populi TaxID=1550736 RepID=A0A3M6QXE9_9BURK|nr:MerR family transcriptional regulator [Corticibacter populi]RMX07678.1 MerR family transcriptional regulator [Corticibacter populi]RZS30186.1 MerR-like DNA binding protein [Corticibacter populi]